MNSFLKCGVVAAVVFFLASSGFAQTNYIYTTNWVAAPSNFRVVNDVTYDTTNSILWTNLAGRVVLINQGVVVIENNLIQNVTTNTPQTLAIRNYAGTAFEGNRITALAMRVGEFNTPTKKLELWDCGTNALVPVTTTNEVGPLDHQAIKKERL